MVDRSVIVTLSTKRMCPYCGDLFPAGSSLVPIHAHGNEHCPGSEQNPRNPASDARPLWNGGKNPHLPPPEPRRPVDAPTLAVIHRADLAALHDVLGLPPGAGLAAAVDRVRALLAAGDALADHAIDMHDGDDTHCKQAAAWDAVRFPREVRGDDLDPRPEEDDSGN